MINNDIYPMYLGIYLLAFPPACKESNIQVKLRPLEIKEKIIKIAKLRPIIPEAKQVTL